LLSPSEIAYWLGSRRTVPTAAEIIDYTGCSAAAAYRWRAFALEGGRGKTGRERRLPPANPSVLASRPRQRVQRVRQDAAARVAGALAVCDASERELSAMLALPPATTQMAIRMLHARGTIRPIGHVAHRPLSRVRGGAIKWSLTNDVSSQVPTGGGMCT
jgi:hypothetical protein